MRKMILLAAFVALLALSLATTPAFAHNDHFFNDNHFFNDFHDNFHAEAHTEAAHSHNTAAAGRDGRDEACC